MEEIRIDHARIIDGTGAQSFLGSVSVANSRITGVFPTGVPLPDAHSIVDAGGKVLAPGFVDTHTHSDMILLHDGAQPSSLLQGVTTEIIGQDGLSYAPLSRETLGQYALYLKGLDGMYDDVALDFASIDEYLSRFAGKSAVNVAYLVPHCALRLETAGFVNRLLTAAEMAQAKQMLRDGIAQGAKGLSTGLSYFPGAYSDTDELIALCKQLADCGGVYVTHLRTVFQGEPFNAVDEALTLARKTGVKLHFSHFRTGGDTIGHTERLMEKIDQAISEGHDITLELYPYPYGASYAPMLVPPWASEGGVEAILQRLQNPALCARIARSIDEMFPHFDGMIAYAAEHPACMGKTFRALADESGKTMGETVAQLLLAERLALSFHDVEPALGQEMQTRFELDVLALLQRPCYMVGSDAIHVGDYPHPRAYGSFAKLLRLARQYHFPLETLVQRMTSLPCERFSLANRGRLQPGYFADMVLFSPALVTDTATVEHPRSAPLGITDVWVNGQPAVANGALTHARAGMRA